MDWKAELAKWPMYRPSFEVRPERTALLVVDMQNWGVRRDVEMGRFISAHYPAIADYFYSRIEELVIPNIQRLLAGFRARGLAVVYLTVGPELADGSDLSDIIKRRLVKRRKSGGPVAMPAKGHWEHDVVEELQPRPGELVINKTSFGAFNSTGLDQLLRNLGVESLVIVGTATDVCVETTARDAADRSYRCVLVDDACATMDHTAHNAALLAFARSFGMVQSTDDVLARLV
ncbi:MAG: cysteine hydrolase [Ardenticatenaceae bacterium]|nr:cysteine hydrolase [Ardenticatenaceae bacterium]HBY96644.1 cysteine hydrolase [Chloroflexota bacterium]